MWQALCAKNGKPTALLLEELPRRLEEAASQHKERPVTGSARTEGFITGLNFWLSEQRGDASKFGCKRHVRMPNVYSVFLSVM